MGICKTLLSFQACEPNAIFIRYIEKALNYRLSRSRVIDELISVTRSEFHAGNLVITERGSQLLSNIHDTAQMEFEFSQT